MSLEKSIAIIDKTKDLCQTIINEPAYQELWTKIETFVADDTAKGQYDALLMKQNELHQKQRQGIRLTREDIQDFEAERDKLYENPIAMDFINTQQTLDSLQKTISQYVNLTMELGRIPTEQDILSASGCSSCSSSSGCSSCN
jgi:cell fate (sporulation/competence/biofilm development) regulator YlbF (YheA/YmcA/DUF963 family)